MSVFSHPHAIHDVGCSWVFSFINSNFSLKDLDNILSKKHWPAILGVREFIEEIKLKYLPQPDVPDPEIPEGK